MRRVVTGEELAQLYNPDPFAMPRWRSPVYRTPLGIILAVKFARLLGWIARLIFRHPLAASVLAVFATLGLTMLIARSAEGNQAEVQRLVEEVKTLVDQLHKQV